MSWDIKITKNSISKIEKTDFSNLSFGRDFTDHMFIADYYDGQWRDMRIVPFGDISMHPASFVLHYAQSIFEGLKAERDPNGDILLFRPIDNAIRFEKSAKRMAMPPVPRDLFLQSITTLIDIERQWIPKYPSEASLYIRPVLFAMDPVLGVRVGDTYRYMVLTGPVGKYYPEPVNVLIQNKYVRAFAGGTGEAKFAGNYAATLLPVMEAKEQGCAQILWTDGHTHSYFQEIGTMNIFFMIDNVLITPALDEGTILHGITRDSLIQIARSLGIEVQERRIYVRELIDAVAQGTLQDMFGAGTAAVVQSISGFVYEGQKYSLDHLNRDLSNKLKDSLIKIKKGLIEDTYGWVYKVALTNQS